MALTATGIISIPIAAFERLIASSAKFLTVTGAANATAAMEFIHLYEAWDEGSDTGSGEKAEPIPRAIIEFGDKWEFESLGPGEHQYEGDIFLAFEFPRSATYDTSMDDSQAVRIANERDALTEFTNNTGSIVKEMIDNSGGNDGSNGYLNVVGISQFTSPAPPRENAQDDHFAVTYIARWRG